MELSGLQDRDELNGVSGRVVAFDSASLLYTVRLRHGIGNFRVRPDNVKEAPKKGESSSAVTSGSGNATTTTTTRTTTTITTGGINGATTGAADVTGSGFQEQQQQQQPPAQARGRGTRFISMGGLLLLLCAACCVTANRQRTIDGNDDIVGEEEDNDSSFGGGGAVAAMSPQRFIRTSPLGKLLENALGGKQRRGVAAASFDDGGSDLNDVHTALDAAAAAAAATSPSQDAGNRQWRANQEIRESLAELGSGGINSPARARAPAPAPAPEGGDPAQRTHTGSSDSYIIV